MSRLVERGSKMGLILNAAKCELATHAVLVADWMIPYSGLSVVSSRTLLGAPLFPGRVLNDFWFDRCRDCTRAVCRLCVVSRQDSLILLRASFSAPRVQHLLRCSPSVDAPGPQEFDNLLRTALSRINNNTLSQSILFYKTFPVEDGIDTLPFHFLVVFKPRRSLLSDMIK